MPDIRQADVAELDSLCELDRVVFGEHSYPKATMRQFIEIAGPLLQVAWYPDEMVAFGLILPATAPGRAWLMALGVKPERRRQGLGAAVTRRLFEECTRNDIDDVRLTVAPDNEAAIGLYERFRFREISHIERYFGPGKDRLVMCCDSLGG
jgi:ribosomal protein S18 acetylase RimI-like enzyme